MELRLEVSMGDIFIFDIDGCIMPNVFPIIKDAKNENETINHEILNKASKLSLFPEFIKFYKRNCVKSLAVYFLTGRKKKYYKQLTEKQLEPIKSYKNYLIEYFPDDKPYTLKKYFKWKANSIKHIMNQWTQDFVRFHIYDDLKELFPIIFQEISPKIKDYNCKLIQKQTDWIHKAKIET